MTVAIGTNPAGGTLSGQNDHGGIGRGDVHDLVDQPVGSGYTLTASSTGLTGATSSTFNVTAATLIANITADNKTYDVAEQRFQAGR